MDPSITVYKFRTGKETLGINYTYTADLKWPDRLNSMIVPKQKRFEFTKESIDEVARGLAENLNAHWRSYGFPHLTYLSRKEKDQIVYEASGIMQQCSPATEDELAQLATLTHKYYSEMFHGAQPKF